MGFMWLWWILGVGLIVAVVWFAVRASGRNGGGGRSGGSRSAEDVLKERYARGEIDDEEYRRRLEELRR